MQHFGEHFFLFTESRCLLLSFAFSCITELHFHIYPNRLIRPNTIAVKSLAIFSLHQQLQLFTAHIKLRKHNLPNFSDKEKISPACNARKSWINLNVNICMMGRCHLSQHFPRLTVLRIIYFHPSLIRKNTLRLFCHLFFSYIFSFCNLNENNVHCKLSHHITDIHNGPFMC